MRCGASCDLERRCARLASSWYNLFDRYELEREPQLLQIEPDLRMGSSKRRLPDRLCPRIDPQSSVTGRCEGDGGVTSAMFFGS